MGNICRNCLNNFPTEDVPTKRQRFAEKTNLPNWKRQMKILLVLRTSTEKPSCFWAAADFECTNNIASDTNNGKTTKTMNKKNR